MTKDEKLAISQEIDEVVTATLVKRERDEIDGNSIEVYDVTKLGPSADLIMVINKLNELINSFNKTLRNNRV